MLDREFSGQRCPDCPLVGDGRVKHCRIHDQWLELLGQYAAGEIDSRRYVEDALNLLARHKEDLRIKLSTFKRGRRER